MSKLDQKGVAGLTVGVALVVVIGVSLAAPVAVDGANVEADSPLYGLERAGESIKETFTGGQEFDLKRVKERRAEYINMIKKGKASKYQNLIVDANDRLDSAMEKIIQSPVDNGKLNRAREAVQEHLNVLENVYENVPDEAKPAITLAIERSAKGSETLADIQVGRIRTHENLEKEIQNIARNAKQNLEKAKQKMRQVPSDKIPEVAQRTELESAERISESIESMGEKYRNHPTVAEEQVESKSRIASRMMTNAAKRSRDNKTLENVERAINKNISVLENVKEKVPVVAKPAISLAISQSAQVQGKIAEVQGLQRGKTSEELDENQRKMLKKGVEEAEKATKRLRKQVRENIGEAEGEERDNKARKAVQNIEINTAKRLQKMAKETLKNENNSQSAAKMLGMAGQRIKSAAKVSVDNEGLNRAIKASQKHEAILENLENKVPEQARKAIQNALKNSQRHREQLENLRKKMGANGRIGDVPSGDLPPMFGGGEECEECETDENQEKGPKGPPAN